MHVSTSLMQMFCSTCLSEGLATGSPAETPNVTNYRCFVSSHFQIQACFTNLMATMRENIYSSYSIWYMGFTCDFLVLVAEPWKNNLQSGQTW